MRLFCSGTRWIQFLRMLKMDLPRKGSRYPMYPKCLTALLCGSAFLKYGLEFLQELDEVGMSLVKW